MRIASGKGVGRRIKKDAALPVTNVKHDGVQYDPNWQDCIAELNLSVEFHGLNAEGATEKIGTLHWDCKRKRFSADGRISAERITSEPITLSGGDEVRADREP